MENLQPLETYRRTGISWVRLGLIFGTASGMVMLLFVVIVDVLISKDDSLTREMTRTLIVTSVGAGLSFPLLFRWFVMRMATSVYRNESPFETVPPGEGYTHRLPSSWRVSDKMAVGGVLFVGDAGAAFVPHSRNLPQFRQVVVIPDGEIRIDLVPQQLTPKRRLMFNSIPPLLRLSSAEKSWLFITPDPEDTARKLRKILS